MIETIMEFLGSSTGSVITWIVSMGGIGASLIKIASIITTIISTNKEAFSTLVDQNKSELESLQSEISELKSLIVAGNEAKLVAVAEAAELADEERSAEIEAQQAELMSLINEARK